MSRIDWREVLAVLWQKVKGVAGTEAAALDTRLSNLSLNAPRKLHPLESVLNAWGQCRGQYEAALVIDTTNVIHGVLSAEALRELSILLGRYAGRIPVTKAANRCYSNISVNLPLRDAVELLADGSDDFLLVTERSGECRFVLSAENVVSLLTEILPASFFAPPDVSAALPYIESRAPRFYQ